MQIIGGSSKKVVCALWYSIGKIGKGTVCNTCEDEDKELRGCGEDTGCEVRFGIDLNYSIHQCPVSYIKESYIQWINLFFLCWNPEQKIIQRYPTDDGLLNQPGLTIEIFRVLVNEILAMAPKK